MREVFKKIKKVLAKQQGMCYNMQGQARPVSQTVKTSPSHGEDMGSIPVRVTNDSLVLSDSKRIPIALGMRIFSLILCAPFPRSGWISLL